MKNLFNHIVFSIAAFVVVASLSACKENTVIRTNVVPAVDNITVFAPDPDTITIYTKNVVDDSVITSAYISGQDVYMGAGAINSDPFFGSTFARFYFQIRQPQTGFSFDKSTYEADSAILILPYSGFAYGDTSITAATQTFKAYRITGGFSKDSLYYSSSPDIAAESTPIGETTISLGQLIKSRYDSTSVLGVKRAPHLRIKLSSGIMDTLLNSSGNSNYADYPAFMSWFKGIYVTCDAGTGNTIPYFRLNGSGAYSTAGILIYYHTRKSGGAITDTLAVSYPFDPQYTAFFNKISRNYSGTPAGALFNSTAISDNTILVQNEPGAAADITFPNVKNFPRCVVNKAEIIITQIGSPLDAVFYSPAKIYPVGVDASGSTYTIADRYPLSSLEPLYFIDGYRRFATIGGTSVSQYVINVPRELQRAIVEQRSLKIRINGTQTFPGAYRLVAGGSGYSNPQQKIRINIIYTKL